ncbi:MAG: hypothetical protein JSV88_12375 [Candidatus Aminicenantes bacterium]|nr:MAG: hypothetical protein JSV88_12375 [Candidatus Aminicenantes bacterium]
MSKQSHPGGSNSNCNDFERWKRELRDTDFDGHTLFHTMSFTQKLAWLSEVVISTYLLAKENPQAGCGSFFHPEFSSL